MMKNQQTYADLSIKELKQLKPVTPYTQRMVARLIQQKQAQQPDWFGIILFGAIASVLLVIAIGQYQQAQADLSAAKAGDFSWNE